MGNYHDIVSAKDFRRLACSECGEDLDVRSHFLKVKIINVDKYGNERRGIEIHIRCINSNCDASKYQHNPDYFKPVFVGAI
jgi:hypothetical protein